MIDPLTHELVMDAYCPNCSQQLIRRKDNHYTFCPDNSTHCEYEVIENGTPPLTRREMNQKHRHRLIKQKENLEKKLKRIDVELAAGV